MLEVYLALRAVPEVDGLGDEGVVLGLEEVLEDVVEDGSLALAEVLALGYDSCGLYRRWCQRLRWRSSDCSRWGWQALRSLTIAVGGIYSVPIESEFGHCVCFSS